jgi:hypothetical protein
MLSTYIHAYILTYLTLLLLQTPQMLRVTENMMMRMVTMRHMVMRMMRMITMITMMRMELNAGAKCLQAQVQQQQRIKHSLRMS